MKEVKKDKFVGYYCFSLVNSDLLYPHTVYLWMAVHFSDNLEPLSVEIILNLVSETHNEQYFSYSFA